MSGNGAYDDEMAFLNRPEPEDRELVAFAQSVRATLVASPPPAEQAAMVTRLAEQARIARAEEPTAVLRPAGSPRRRVRLALQAAAAVVLVPLVGAGLATAGVKLPGPAQSAFESVGIELPNQAEKADDLPPAEPAGQGDGGVGAEDTPAAKGKAAPNGNTGNGKSKSKSKENQSQAGGRPDAPGDNGNGNGKGAAKGKSRGNSGQAPGQTGSTGNAGGNGKAKAVGKTEATPPGQAAKPIPPGNSGNSGNANGKGK